MKKVIFTAAIAALLCSCCAKQQSIEDKVEDALSQMTLNEKIAVIHAQSKFSSAGVPRLGIPELWTDDGPHGVRPDVLWDQWGVADQTNDSCTAFPALTCLAATWNRDMASLYGKSVGEEARYRKKNVLLGPGVNICRTPLCGRNFEYMGEDPFLAGQMAVPYIKGVQSNNVAVCVKHFALNNQEFMRHGNNVIVDDRVLYEIYLPAFKAAVQEGGAWSIMSAYNLYQNQHLGHNKRILCDILKGEWGFDGAVISDWGAAHNTDEAIHNGLDIEFGTWTDGVAMGKKNAYDSYFLADPYKEKIKSGEVGTEELDDKVRRALRLNFRTQLGGNWGSFCSPEHFAAARRIAGEGIVLLKNEGEILPVKKDVSKILVLGENAIKPFAVGGMSSSLKAHHEISVLDGLRAAFPDAEVVFERAYMGQPVMATYGYSNYDISDPRTADQLKEDAVRAVAESGADYVIFVGGLNKVEGNDCESVDRLSYELPYGQNDVIEAIAAVRPDMVYVNISGSPVAMPFADKVGAVLQGWYCGSEAGNAIADVLSGAVNPSGKLPFTFPVQLADGPIKTENQYPGIKDENGIWQTEYSEGIYVGYRWYDTREVRPQWAFGYGLSYTTFEYGDARLSPKTIRKGGNVKVSVPVTNTGKVAGAEVVQLYIADTEASVDRPAKELKGFEKVYLEPGETKTVSFTIGSDDLCWFDAASHQWVNEPGEFKAIVAAASNDIRAEASFELK